jgi:hypothetical protein
MDDPFDNLDSLRLTPQAVALARPAKPIRSRSVRVAGEFYLCPIAWADKAMAAVASKKQLILALRLYRCWKLRGPKESIVVSHVALAGPGFLREIKRRTIKNLQAAGLLEIVEQGRRGRSPRVRIID